MIKKVPRYTPEFRRRMVELHRTGRTFAELAAQFAACRFLVGASMGALYLAAEQMSSIFSHLAG